MLSKAALAVGTFVAVCALALSGTVSAPHYTFSLAGNYPGAALTYPSGANLTQIAGRYVPVGGAVPSAGYIQTGKSFITAQPAGSTSSYLFSINANGLAVGGFCQNSVNCGGNVFAAHGYTYDYATGATTSIDYPGAGTTAAYGINDSGVIVGGFCTSTVTCPNDLFNGASHAFMNANGVFTQLDFPGADETTAFGINNAGAIVGVYEIHGQTTTVHGFLYKNGAYMDLNFPGANWSEAAGINDAGIVVGWYQDPNLGGFGFMYYNGQWAQINARSSGATAITGINNHNDLVGNWSGFNGLHPIKGIPTKSIPMLAK